MDYIYTKKVVSTEINDKLVNLIIGYAIDNEMTLSCIKDSFDEACNIFEDNDILKDDIN